MPTQTQTQKPQFGTYSRWFQMFNRQTGENFKMQLDAAWVRSKDPRFGRKDWTGHLTWPDGRTEQFRAIGVEEDRLKCAVAEATDMTYSNPVVRLASQDMDLFQNQGFRNKEHRISVSRIAEEEAKLLRLKKSVWQGRTTYEIGLTMHEIKVIQDYPGSYSETVRVLSSMVKEAYSVRATQAFEAWLSD